LVRRTTIDPAIGARGWLSQAGMNGVRAAMISSTSAEAPNCDRELVHDHLLKSTYICDDVVGEIVGTGEIFLLSY
jgi:hypothetical protein